MARPWRIQFHGAVYHVTARGNRRQDIFFDDSDRLDFLRILGLAAARFDLRIFAFCLMTNHYHLFLRTPQPNLSAALHWLNATYSIRLNLRRRLSGHLFQGRFKSALVATDAHWHKLSIYIHLNPVRAKLVEDPADYEWSSCRDYLAAAPRYPWLDPAPILAAFGRGRAGIRRYRSALAGALDQAPEYWDEWRREMAEAERAEMTARAPSHAPAGNPTNVPEFFHLQRQTPDLLPDLHRLAHALGLDPDLLLRRQRNFPQRFIAYYFFVEIKRLPLTDIARFFSVSHTAISSRLPQARQLILENPSLARVLNSLST